MDPGEDDRPPGRPRPAADERIAHAFADGYGEGIRDALREVLEAVRTSTPAELRWQVQSRIARIPEDVELKRRSLLGPPPRDGWEATRRAPRSPAAALGPPPAPATPAPTLTQALQGSGVLFQEVRPSAALAHVGGIWRQYGRVFVFGRVPDPPLPVPDDAVTVVAVGRARIAGPEGDAPDLGGAAGQLMALIGEGTALVYCDSVEYLATEYSEGTAVRALIWIVEQLRARSGGVVVSVNPAALQASSRAQLERMFKAGRSA